MRTLYAREITVAFSGELCAFHEREIDGASGFAAFTDGPDDEGLPRLSSTQLSCEMMPPGAGRESPHIMAGSSRRAENRGLAYRR
jgi:hypothetical protein